MRDLIAQLQAGGGAYWVWLPTAMLLGALHGLEPGHSKSLMAAFIVAIRGTVLQAILLGLSVTISHSLVVWLIAGIGLAIGDQLIADQAEPWLQLVSGILVAGMALWMARQVLGPARAPVAAGNAPHGHHHHHDHAHGHDHDHHHHDPNHHHHHHHAGMDPQAHAEMHRREVEAMVAQGPVTNGKIVLFGLTGGLVPCPGAVTVLLVALQVGAGFAGAVMVLGFSVGLALSLVGVGVVAALGTGRLARLLGGEGGWSRRLPLLSAWILIVIAVISIWQGVAGIRGGRHAHPVAAIAAPVEIRTA